MDALIEADGLSKKFGKVQALSDLTLTLPAGKPVAILGPNGAGKTTFIRMVATLLQPDRGHAARRRPRRGARPDGGAPHDRPGRPVGRGRGDDDRPGEPGHGGPPLRAAGRCGQAERRRGSSSRWTWSDAADRQVRTYSGGMRRRLDLGASLVGSPRLLLLDEPTTGLDPGSRNEVWDGIREMSWAGTDIVLTTQYLDEADHLAASIVIIDGGPRHRPGHARRAEVAGRRRHDRVAHGRRPHHVPGGRGARVARHGRAGHRPRHAAVLHRRTGRLATAARSSSGPWTRPPSRWRTSPCAGPPSTRCSWP